MSIGVAMIARNGADTMEHALAPFLAGIDQISIVLGGPSEDDTAEIARKYGDIVGQYDGILGDNGLFDFGHARQQAFDQLSTDYAIVVDTDDSWGGLEWLGFILAEADKHRSPAVLVQYNLTNSVLHQPRIFRREAGRWAGYVHERFDFLWDTPPLATSDITVTQNAQPDKNKRGRQNIIIGEYALSQNPNDTRAIAHLVRDYRVADENEKAYELCLRYLDITNDQKRSKSEYEMVLETKSEIEMLEMRPRDSFLTAIEMLAIGHNGTAWSTLAEAAYKLANGSEGLLRLSILAADEALRSGKSRGGHAHKTQMSGSIPCLLKAMALYSLGQKREALRAADLGLLIDPTNKYLKDAQLEIVKDLSEVI